MHITQTQTLDLQFVASTPLSMGIELELQLQDPSTHDLRPVAQELLAWLAPLQRSWVCSPEITQSMFEVATSVHHNLATMLQELRDMQQTLLLAAEQAGVLIAGGGVHSFHRWQDRRISPEPRYQHLFDTYGYLAKLFTVFGQHIHIGCANGDAALQLCHQLQPYIPHFIALASSSPFFEGVDTRYETYRLNVVDAFPFSGYIPAIDSWADFCNYAQQLADRGVIASMKDFYWDIRPKPHLGTIEIRVSDCPLTLQLAADLAAYAQALAAYLQAHPQPLYNDQPAFEMTYQYNRFQACRYGVDGQFVDVANGRRQSLSTHMLTTCDALEATAATLASADALQRIYVLVEKGNTGAAALRQSFKGHQDIHLLEHLKAELWKQSF